MPNAVGEALSRALVAHAVCPEVLRGSFVNKMSRSGSFGERAISFAFIHDQNISLWRLKLTLNMSPTAAMLDSIALPPALIMGSGIPVTGMIPEVIPTLTNI